MAQALWSDVAAAYDRSFASLCSGTAPMLVEPIPAGSRVLDVGCGSGHLAAELTSAGHEVHGVDPDPEMVALTASRSAASVTTGALPDLPFAEGSFDVVLANFVLNHVDDPRVAARGLARVVRPGGRVAATIWPGRPPEQGKLWNAVLDAADAVRPEMPRLAPELDFERSVAGLSDLLTGAGLEIDHTHLPVWDWSVAPDDFWAGVTTVGNFGVSWRAQTPQVQEAMREAFADAATPWESEGRLVFPVEAVMVWAVA